MRRPAPVAALSALLLLPSTVPAADCRVTAQRIADQATPTLTLDEWKEVEFNLVLQEGFYYRLFDETIEGRDKLQRFLVFDGLAVDGNRATYFFRRPDGRRVTVIGRPARTRRGASIPGAIAPDSGPAGGMGRVLNLLLGTHLFAQKSARLIFHPYPTRFEARGLSIVGGKHLADDEIQAVAARLMNFDAKLEGIGLRLPDQSRIVISDSRIPDLSGPCFIQPPLFSFWDRRCYSTIDLPPLGLSRVSYDDPAVLLHERVHAVLQASFSKDALLIRSASLQEAFADILAAHSTNKPRIGEGFPTPMSALRDISERPYRAVTLDSSGDEHANSQHISYLLWTIRSQMLQTDSSGRSFDELLGSLLKRIDRKDQVVDIFNAASRKSKSGADTLAHDFLGEFLYVMVHLEDELRQRGLARNWERAAGLPPYPEGFKHLDDSRQRMRELIRRTAPREREVTSPRGKLGNNILVHALPGVLVVEGYILYELFDKD